MKGIGMIHYRYMNSPVGELLLAGDKTGLKLIKFPKSKRTYGPLSGWEERSKSLKDAVEQLDAYFAGKLKEFDLKLSPNGTPFQRNVWDALLDIPYGETVSYGDVARQIENPKASRPVGGAVGRNPLAIIIPCHRVIGTDGSLTGFGGGLETKKILLALEQNNR